MARPIAALACVLVLAGCQAEPEAAPRREAPALYRVEGALLRFAVAPSGKPNAVLLSGGDDEDGVAALTSRYPTVSDLTRAILDLEPGATLLASIDVLQVKAGQREVIPLAGHDHLVVTIAAHPDTGYEQTIYFAELANESINGGRGVPFYVIAPGKLAFGVGDTEQGISGYFAPAEVARRSANQKSALVCICRLQRMGSAGAPAVAEPDTK